MIHKTKALNNRMIRANFEELAITFLKTDLCPLVGGARKRLFSLFFFLFYKIDTMAMSQREGEEGRNSVTLGLEPYYLKDPKVMVRNADF